MLSKTLFLLFDEGVLIVSDAESKQSDYPNRWRMFTVTQVEELKILIRIYDMIIVPIARKFTRKERGFTDLQRIGISLFISTMCMSVAAIVEIIRLKLAKEHLTLNIFWQVPQYVLMGASNVFMFAGQLEFFLLPISRCYAKFM
ncbi:putative proton-dependent oligopeptide transporter family [Lupinus albus]|uniref:Putative proton-dependent oligopeptide transporter family n=1 Tax=Lupinus albus TaxID=3870 RepID=A0A6A4PHI7_LUPAL|nr:putative proton-dependent oligopeptide transporter family [Lupinus albus]